LSASWVTLAAMRISAYIQLFALALAFAWMQACTPPRNFDDEIKAVDSLHVQMDQALVLLDSATLPISDSITRQLKYIQTNFKGIMEQPAAERLLRFGQFRNKAATLEQWKDSLHFRKDQLENELYAFRNVLADKATHDRTNREISELYADSVLMNLIDKQQYWHTKVNEWIQQHDKVQLEWRLLNDTITTWRESIPKRPNT
jgi:hypothetical protein